MQERQKLYFLDYTQFFSYVNRVYKILYKRQINGFVSIGLDRFVRAMNWGNGVFNQGRSEKGKRYVSMESYLRKNEALLCFSRPIYFDYSNRPYLLEYAYLNRDFELVFDVFDNV
jgi:hypothetical protein